MHYLTSELMNSAERNASSDFRFLALVASDALTSFAGWIEDIVSCSPVELQSLQNIPSQTAFEAVFWSFLVWHYFPHHYYLELWLSPRGMRMSTFASRTILHVPLTFFGFVVSGFGGELGGAEDFVGCVYRHDESITVRCCLPQHAQCMLIQEKWPWLSKEIRQVQWSHAHPKYSQRISVHCKSLETAASNCSPTQLLL